MDEKRLSPEALTDETEAEGYEPPQLVILGPIEAATLGSGGSKSDAGQPVRL